MRIVFSAITSHDNTVTKSPLFKCVAVDDALQSTKIIQQEKNTTFRAKSNKKYFFIPAFQRTKRTRPMASLSNTSAPVLKIKAERKSSVPSPGKGSTAGIRTISSFCSFVSKRFLLLPLKI